MVFDNGSEALYQYHIDPDQTTNLLESTLDSEASEAYQALLLEANRIRD